MCVHVCGGVVAHGLCKKHGALGVCSFGNCKTVAVGKERRSKHGGQSKNECKKINQRRTRPQHSCCSTLPLLQAWCVWNLQNQRMRHHHNSGSQHCSKHGRRKAKPCSVVGCTTTSRRKGLCARHGDGFIIYSEYIAMSNATLNW